MRQRHGKQQCRVQESAVANEQRVLAAHNHNRCWFELNHAWKGKRKRFHIDWLYGNGEKIAAAQLCADFSFIFCSILGQKLYKLYTFTDDVLVKHTDWLTLMWIAFSQQQQHTYGCTKCVMKSKEAVVCYNPNLVEKNMDTKKKSKLNSTLFANASKEASERASE